MPRKESIKIFFPLVFLILVGCSSEEFSYFPLKQGHWWEYQETFLIRDESHTSRRIVSNLQSITIEGKRLFVQESQGQDRQFFSLMEEGVFREYLDQKSLDQKISDQNKSDLIMPFDQKKSWSLMSRLGVIESRTFARQDKLLTRVKPIVLTFSIVSTDEDVIVPAGRFKNCLKVKGVGFTTVKVDRRNGTAEVHVESFDWYAPGVGLIKTERTERSENTFLTQGFYTLDLLKYRKN